MILCVSGNQDNLESRDLRIISQEPVNKDILIIYFEQFTEKAELTKQGKNKWILKVADHSGTSDLFITRTEPFVMRKVHAGYFRHKKN